MTLFDLLNTDLTKEQQKLKKSFEDIALLFANQHFSSFSDDSSCVIDQLQQLDCFQRHQLHYEKNKVLRLEKQIFDLRKIADLAESHKKDNEFQMHQNLQLVDIIAKANEELRLVQAKNEHLRTEFSTKINLLNQSIKDHRENFNALEREKKRQDAELKALREELFTCKLALSKHEPDS